MKIRTEPVQHVGFLLSNFRLLEAAGACGLIADTAAADDAATESHEWWRAVGAISRSYRGAIYSTIVRGFSAVDDWSNLEAVGSDRALARERRRVVEEHRRWLCQVPGGQAYVAWLGAYVAAAELDGERALDCLNSCAAIARDFAHAPDLGREPSRYDFLQSAANTLALFLPLPEHPMRDMRRFAFLPSPLQTGYGL